MAESWPTEHAATLAVDAAARKAYYERVKTLKSRIPQAVQDQMSGWGPWEDLEPHIKLQFRDQVLPTVWVALAALPDPRYAAWEEGYADGYEIHPGNQAYPNNNPYQEA